MEFSDYVIFDQDVIKIPNQDLPIGELLICHGVQDGSWAVIDCQNDFKLKILGLFYDKEHAKLFAKALIAENYDPSPWCSGCGAMTKNKCKCGPIADND